MDFSTRYLAVRSLVRSVTYSLLVGVPITGILLLDTLWTV